jgi:hypothetical protein
VLEACDTAAAVWMRLIRTPQLKLKTDSLFGTRHSFARRRGCVVVVDGLQDSTTAWPDDLRDGLPGARWRSHSRYDADGAGSTSFAVWRPGVLCLTHWEVPAGIDDDGRHITGDSEHVEVTCVPALPGDTPDRTPASGARRVGDEMQRDLWIGKPAFYEELGYTPRKTQHAYTTQPLENRCVDAGGGCAMGTQHAFLS